MDYAVALLNEPAVGRRTRRLLWHVLLLSVLFASSPNLAGYSMLTHEEIVDLAWSDQIEPLLKQRFPQATTAERNEAHAYAYGGCIIQDLGYYPFGNKDFSNLLHYVRTGDFVAALLRDADDLDVVQVAKGRFTSDSYHNFVGFQVSKPLVEQAFRETYGLGLGDVLKNPDLAIGTYRRSVSKIVPEMTRVALLTKHAELVQENPDFDQRKFLYRLSRTEYEKQWGNQYQRRDGGHASLPS